MSFKKGNKNKKIANILINIFLNKKRRQLSSIGAFWLLVTSTGQISTKFMEDLKRLAYYW